MSPVIAAQTGQADVEINGAKSQLSGFCNTNEMVLQFWTDGNGAPAQRDLNGDGNYLDARMHSGMRSMQGGAAVQLMSGGEWIYKGIARPATRDGATLTLEHSYTRLPSKGGGDFDIKVTITCSG
jgi:hypothetical protein